MKNIFFLLVSPFWSSSPPPRSQNSFEDKKNNRKKEKNFSGTKVQLYIDKGKKLLIYQCYFGETMQAKGFHDQALKESEREEYWIRLLQYVAVWCCGAEIMYVSSILM